MSAPVPGASTKTLLLTRTDVRALLDPAALVAPMCEAFVAYSAAPEGRALRARSSLPALSGPGTATVLFPGTAPGVPAYTVKVHAKFPAQDPAIRGVLCLHDLATGALLAVMDSTYLTAVRTGIAGAVAADVLARPDGDTAAVVGAGVQGTHQLRALASLRALRHVSVYDTSPDRAQAFAAAMAAELRLPVTLAPSLEHAVAGASIVLVATWSKTPFIMPGMLGAGAHVTTLGPDEPGKAEVDARVIRDALFVCDDRALAVELGALQGVGLGLDAVGAELGEVIGGTHPGRTSPAQTTIYGGVGLAFQDTIAAWQVYQAARAKTTGRDFDFLA
jgi:ornithine cyclodeaminase/alanine dehydrogenase-like protein (mu-crystallin family)